MPTFDLDAFITDVRQAAVRSDAVKQVRALMNAAFLEPDAVRAAMSRFSGEEEVLFEDDSVSVWYVGFDPHRHVPPHDHEIHAFIGVYEGQEKNHFYLVGDNKLEHKSTKMVAPGDVIAIGPDAIHSVETANDEFCRGIHVYLGPLTTVQRSLFDWDSGVAEPFTDEAYDRLLRTSY